MPKVSKVIIITKPNGEVEAWGCTIRMCAHYGWSKWTLYKKVYPFVYNGWKFNRKTIL